MRILISSIALTIMYLISGINEIKNFSKITNEVKNKIKMKMLPLIFYKLIMIIVISIKLLAPSIIVYSLYTETLLIYGLYSCYILIGFTILATALYHPPTKKGHYYHFIKNISIIGGLLALSDNFIQ